MDEFFDFANSPNLTPPSLGSQPLSMACDATRASGIKGVPFPQ
jgi:hypothetical protein